MERELEISHTNSKSLSTSSIITIILSLTCHQDLADLFVVISLHLGVLPADCTLVHHSRFPTNHLASFAFVEYESRRDADDAYHEMHNRRIGRDRDEVLKIEVSTFPFT
jgi:hypothetical protein